MDNSNPLSDGVMSFAVTDLLHLVLGAQITNSGTDLKPPPSQNRHGASKHPWNVFRAWYRHARARDARGSITGGRDPKSWVAVTDYFLFLKFDEIRMT